MDVECHLKMSKLHIFDFIAFKFKTTHVKVL